MKSVDALDGPVRRRLARAGLHGGEFGGPAGERAGEWPVGNGMRLISNLDMLAGACALKPDAGRFRR